MKIEVSKSDLKLIVAALDSFGLTQGEYGRGLMAESESQKAEFDDLEDELPDGYLADETRCNEIIAVLEAQSN
jgi:hypothetical protein